MMDLDNRLLYMQDVLEHLGRCYDQWNSGERTSHHHLASAIRRDLAEMRRLCATTLVQRQVVSAC